MYNDPSAPFVSAADLSVSRIRREVERYFASRNVSPTACYGLTVEQANRAVGADLAARMIARIATKKIDYKKVSFPAGPWQFVKFNTIGSWAYSLRIVRWYLAKYPVKCITVEMTANAFHPDVEIPDHETFVDILLRARTSYDLNG